MIDKPTYVSEEMLVYLDDLKDSAVTNMFGARPYLLDAFPKLNMAEATNVLSYWMQSYGERHPRE